METTVNTDVDLKENESLNLETSNDINKSRKEN